MKRYDASELPVTPLSHPTKYDPTNDPSAPQQFINAIAPPATLRGSVSAIQAKNGPYGRVHRGTGNHEQSVAEPEARRSQQVGPVERYCPDQQKRPHEILPVAAGVRKIRTDDHQCCSGKIRPGRQPTNQHDRSFARRLQHGRQPDDEAIDADAPAEILDRKRDDHGRAECRRVIPDRLELALFVFELALEFDALIGIEPFCLGRPIVHHGTPDKGPDNRRGAFDDEHTAPAE